MPRSVGFALAFLLVAALGAGGYVAYQLAAGRFPQPADPSGLGAPAAGGKLVVLVVFDQMRGDYLARWAGQFGPGGFERMKTDGVWFSQCHLPYACSSTGPGHASIVTGAPPSVHGIIENDWYDRAAAARVYCCQPARPYDLVPPPPKSGTASRGSDAGFSPEKLLADTVSDRVAAGGKGRVVSLSLKDRTAVLMGGKKPAAAYCFDTRDGLFHTGAYYRDAVHPWAGEVNAGGLSKAWAGKAWTRFRTDLDYDRLAGPDDAAGEGYGYAQKRVFPHPMGPNPTPDAGYYGAVEASPAGNELLLALTKKAVAAEKLGNAGAADLLCVSFSSTDLIGHQWGPDSWEVLDITLRADKLMADLLAFLDETCPGRYVVAVTADHGVGPIPEQKRYPQLYPAAARTTANALLTPLAAALDETFGRSPAGPTKWLEVVGKDADAVWPWVYLNHAAIKARGLDPAAVADYAAQWLGNRPTMLTAFTRRHVEADTLPPAAPGAETTLRPILGRVRLAYHPDRCGDVLVVPQPGVVVSPYETGTGHGTPHDYDRHVPVLVYGAGVPAAGKRDRPVSSLVVAPTLAWALGVPPPEKAAEQVPAEVTAK